MRAAALQWVGSMRSWYHLAEKIFAALCNAPQMELWGFGNGGGSTPEHALESHVDTKMLSFATVYWKYAMISGISRVNHFKFHCIYYMFVIISLVHIRTFHI